MPSGKITTLDPAVFNYGRFESDINNWCKQNKTTMDDFSVNYLIRSKQYLSGAIQKRRLPVNVGVAICTKIGKQMRDYNVEHTAKKPEPAVIQKPVEAPRKEWDVVVDVNENFGALLLQVHHNGVKIASDIGRWDDIPDGAREYVQFVALAQCVVDGLEKYRAAHGIKGCFKLVNCEEQPPEPKQEVVPQTAPHEDASRKTFKAWIMQYYDSHSDAGRLARYIDELYEEFPSWGRNKMLTFMQMHHGNAHRATFDAYFEQYRKWSQAAERANSDRLKK